MVMNFVNLFSQALTPMTGVQSKSTAIASSSSNNPFANPFLNGTSNQFYGKNTPVKGGYFAGYYNGKQNIVGSRLFIEV